MRLHHLPTLSILTLAFAACDATEYVPPMPASAIEVEFLTASASGAPQPIELVFRYIGETPSPCYDLHSYGSSHDSAQPDRVEVDVSVDVEDGVACPDVLGQVEVEELRVPVPGPGVFDIAFERVGAEPLVKRYRVRDVEVTEE